MGSTSTNKCLGLKCTSEHKNTIARLYINIKIVFSQLKDLNSKEYKQCIKVE